MWARNLLFIGVFMGSGIALFQFVFPRVTPTPIDDSAPPAVKEPDFRQAVDRVDDAFERQWQKRNLTPAGPAPELAVMRRLALGLMGTIPSLQEIRQFEAQRGDRLQWWLDSILKDSRFHGYLAERLARAYVGTDDGPFLVYRRRRFVSWITQQIETNRPYDGIVRDMIEAEGLWTDNPQANFLTATIEQGKKNQPNPDRLAGRVTRAFLGIRLDCAQCHDHPFQEWTQRDFQELAAFFAQARNGPTGLYEDESKVYEIEKRGGRKRLIDPAVPAFEDVLPQEGSLRRRLAVWVTHPENRYFALATVNRVWAILCGHPLVDPIDDLNTEGEIPEPLVLLAADFVSHHYDLQRLIRIITATRAFRLDSAADHELTPEHTQAWAAFPIKPLRPEQMAGAVLQAARVTTNNDKASSLLQLIRFTQTNDFVKRYGDLGEDEFRERSCTIPQVLLVMNGKLVKEATKQGFFGAATRIGWQAPSDRRAVEVAFLTVLTRRPSLDVLEHFENRLRGTKGNQRSKRMEDLFWALINSTEFKCSH